MTNPKYEHLTPPTIEVGRRGRNGHGYRLDGKDVPSVTTLIKGGLPAPALTYWAANEAARYAADHPELVDQLGTEDAYDLYRRAPWNRRDRAAVNGTDVHRLAQRLAADETVDVPGDQLGYVEACAAFLDDHDVEVVAAERPVANVRYHYCGTFDLLANTKHGLALVDYKTSASGVFVESALQLAGYRHAEWMVDNTGDVVPMLPVDLCAVCWLRPDSYELYPVDAGDATFRLFLHVARVAQGAGVLRDTFLGAPL